MGWVLAGVGIMELQKITETFETKGSTNCVRCIVDVSDTFYYQLLGLKALPIESKWFLNGGLLKDAMGPHLNFYLVPIAKR